ncbi:MAG: hypothetical protein IJO63_02440 [Bacilli bacterium]|nr:hypothetical protein [Bacilli bacterium]
MTKEKRKITLSVISTLILICTIISASYAFYVIAVSEKVDIATEVKIPACASADLGSATKISLTGDNAAPISDLKALSSTTYRYAFTVTNNCSVTSNLVISVAPTTSSTMPMTALKYALVEQSADAPKHGSYFNDAKALTAQIVSEVKANANVTVDVGYEILSTTIAAGKTKSYYLYLWVDYYEGDKTQTGANNNITLNKSFEGQLIISDYKSASEVNFLGDAIVALGDGSERTSSQDSTKYRVINQNGYRYEGKDPNNYISFNGETWRIIGAFEGSTIGLTEGEYYTKIIRPTFYPAAIGVFNGTTTNNSWASSTVNKYMNSEYLSSLSESARSMITNAKWYLGALSSGPTNTGALYNMERASTGAYSAPSVLNVRGYMGLIYPSDYFYGAYGSGCDNNVVYYNNQTSSCMNLNWLYSSTNIQYTITGNSEGTSVNIIFSDNGTYDGFIHTAVSNNTSCRSRPTLYLNNDVILTGGSGTSASPYTISQ